MFGTGCVAFFEVLRMPFAGRFMCPFAVAVLGGRYFVISRSVRLGHPSRYPARVAFSSVEMGGLHKDWCANFTALTFVRIECVKFAVSSIGGFFITSCGFPAVALLAWRGSVHKSVLGSLNPVKIILLLYITSHLSSVNNTLHPCLHRTRMPMRDAMVNCGMM